LGCPLSKLCPTALFIMSTVTEIEISLSLTITDVYPNELTFIQQLHDNELLNNVDLSGLELIETMLFIDTN